MVEKIVIIPEEVRGLGDIVSPKSASDFLCYSSKVTSSTDTDYGTVYTGEYKAGSSITVTSIPVHISSDASSITVTGSLKDSSNNAISGATIKYRINDVGVATTTNNSGAFTFTVNIGDPSDHVIAPSDVYLVNIWYEGSSTVGGCFITKKIYSTTVESVRLVSDKDLTQTGDTVNLFALVDNEGMNGEILTVLSQNVNFLKYNPELFKYTGTGGTETDSFVSQTGVNAVSSTSSASGTVMTTSSTGTGFTWANLTGTSTSVNDGDYIGDISVDVDVVSTNGNNRLVFYESYSATTLSIPFVLQGGHNRIVKTGSVYEHFVDNVSVGTYTIGLIEPLRIGFIIENGKTLTFKNFVIGGY